MIIFHPSVYRGTGGSHKQSTAISLAHQVGGIAHTQLDKEALTVVLYGILGHEEASRNLDRGKAVRYKLENLVFPSGQVYLQIVALLHP